MQALSVIARENRSDNELLESGMQRITPLLKAEKKISMKQIK